MEIFKVTMVCKKVIIQHNFMKFNMDNNLKIVLFFTVSKLQDVLCFNCIECLTIKYI